MLMIFFFAIHALFVGFCSTERYLCQTQFDYFVKAILPFGNMIFLQKKKWRRELSCEKERGRKEKLFSNYSTPKTSTRAVDKILHNMILYHICQGHVMEMFIKYDGLSCAKQKMAAGNSLWP